MYPNSYMPHERAADELKAGIRRQYLEGGAVNGDDWDKLDDMRSAELMKELPGIEQSIEY